MKLPLPYKTITTHLFFIFGFVFLSISLYIIIFVSGQWEEEYKKELQQKYDRDYYKASLEVDENNTGEYFQDTKNIIIYTKNREAWHIKRTAIHEICHFIFFEKLNETVREEWKILYDDSVSHYGLNDTEKIYLLMNGSSIFVSNYAEKNELEDFAESCSAFALGLNKLDFRKEIFMKRYIKNLI